MVARRRARAKFLPQEVAAMGGKGGGGVKSYLVGAIVVRGREEQDRKPSRKQVVKVETRTRLREGKKGKRVEELLTLGDPIKNPGLNGAKTGQTPLTKDAVLLGTERSRKPARKHLPG